MHPAVYRHAAKRRLDGRSPEIGTRRVHLLDLDLLAIQGQVGGRHHLRHYQGLGCLLGEDGAPIGQLGILGLLDVIDHVLAGQDLDVGEGRLDGFQPEVEVGIPAADVDGGQSLAALLDQIHQRLAVIDPELGVDEDGLLVAGHQLGGDGEDGLVAGVVDGHCQGARQGGATEQGGGQGQGAKYCVHGYASWVSGHRMDTVYCKLFSANTA
ncbi:hypothetical protein D3C80_1460730 [compost metagenome]